jgi:CRISPR-associated protein Csm2
MSDINDVIQKINACKTLNEIDNKDLIDFETGYAYIVAENSKGLKTTQLRKFFGALKKMEQKESWDEIETDFYLLKPRMAVASGRGHVPKPFLNVVMAAMSKVDNVEEDEEKMENFDKFVKFFEAIVAYHKYLYPKAR